MDGATRHLALFCGWTILRYTNVTLFMYLLVYFIIYLLLFETWTSVSRGRHVNTRVRTRGVRIAASASMDINWHRTCTVVTVGL